MGTLLAFPSGDPITDFHNYDAAKERELLMRPKCAMCGEHIQDDYCYLLSPNMVACENCIKDNFRVSTESLMEDR